MIFRRSGCELIASASFVSRPCVGELFRDCSEHDVADAVLPRPPGFYHELFVMSDIYQQYNAVEKLIDAEDYAAAVEPLKAILEQDDSFVLGHLAMARVLTKLGQHHDAVKHGERACELEPNESFNYTALSVTYQRAWAGTKDQSFITKAEDAMARSHQLQRG